MTAPSVVILTCGRVRELELVLRALAGQTLPPGEVVLVEDEQSGERSSAHLGVDSLPFPVRAFPAPEGSFAERRNAGIAKAQGEIVAFLDDDCEPDRHWLARLTGALEENGWVAAGGAVLPADGLPAPARYAPELAWLAGLTPPGFFGPLAGRLYHPMTANLAARREVFREFPFQALLPRPGMDRFLYDLGREDAQWWRSLRRAGKAVGAVPRAIAWHHIDKSRLEWDRLAERAEADGRAHWRREGLREELPGAARDVLYSPAGVVREALSGPHTLRQCWAVRSIWARRQWSLLREAVDDHGSGVTPTTRLRMLCGGLLGLFSSEARVLLRPMAATLHRSMGQGVPAGGKPPRSVLFVLHDFLGDSVLALPALRQLCEALPRTRVTVLTGPSCAPLLRTNVEDFAGEVRPRILEVPPAARGGSPLAGLRLHGLVRREAPDVVLIAYAHGLHPAPLFLLGAPVVAWREDNGLERQLYAEILARPVPKSFEKHEAAALLDLLAPFGIGTRLRRPRIRASERARSRVTRILERADFEPGTYAVLHVERAGRFKFWPPENFARLAQTLAREGVPLFLEGSPSGRAAVEPWAGEIPRCQALHGLLDSDELTALLESAALFVGADSGPSHVARAAGTPTVLLFGMSEPHRWGALGEGVPPEGGPVEVLSGAPGNSLPGENAGLPADWGMRLLGVEEVARVALGLLHRKKTPSRGRESR